MAQTSPTITVPLPRLTVKIRLPRAYGLRMWLTTVLLTVTGWVCPHDIEIEINGIDNEDDAA